MCVTEYIKEYFEENANEVITREDLSFQYGDFTWEQIRGAVYRIKDTDKRLETVERGKSWRLNIQPIKKMARKISAELPDWAQAEQHLHVVPESEPLVQFKIVGDLTDGNGLSKGTLLKAVSPGFEGHYLLTEL